MLNIFKVALKQQQKIELLAVKSFGLHNEELKVLRERSPLFLIYKFLEPGRDGTHQALERQRQEDQEFEAILSYMKPCLKKQKQIIGNIKLKYQHLI